MSLQVVELAKCLAVALLGRRAVYRRSISHEHSIYLGPDKMMFKSWSLRHAKTVGDSFLGCNLPLIVHCVRSIVQGFTLMMGQMAGPCVSWKLALSKVGEGISLFSLTLSFMS